METNSIHKIELAVVKTGFTEFDEGTEITLMVRATCGQICDLRGKNILFTGKDGNSREIALTKFNGIENESDEFIVKTSAEPGEYIWTADYPDQEGEDVAHKASNCAFSFPRRHHSVSVAVWDIPDFARINERFNVKAGAKCSAGCDISGCEVQISDREGVASPENRLLGGEPAEGTAALYWAEIPLNAPDKEGVFTWTAKFTGAGIHKESQSSFCLKAVGTPECTVTVEAISKNSLSPVVGADVIVHPHRAKTGENGKAVFDVAKGRYRLFITGIEGYKTYSEELDVTGDTSLTLKLEEVVVAEEDPGTI